MAKKKLLIAAIVVGALAAGLLLLYANQMQNRERDLIGETVPVIKAARTIPAGTPLSRELVTTDDVPVKFLPPNPVEAKDLEIYLGQAVSVNIQEGAMVLTSDFSVAEVSRDLAGKIPKDERALSIPVDQISGVSGLLRPGDRVDLLATFPVSDKDQLVPSGDGGGASVGYVTMTLLQNVTLLATGQLISNVGGEQKGRNNYSTVTLSVTIDEAELLTIAQTRGKLTLLLRNSGDVETGKIVKTSLVDVMRNLELIQEKRKKRNKGRKKPVKKPGDGFTIETGDGKR